MSPHFSKLGLFTRFIVERCLFRAQYPVRMSVNLLILRLVWDKNNLVLHLLIEIQFLACLAILIVRQCLSKAFSFHSVNNLFCTGISGSGPRRVVLEAIFANSSSFSFPGIPLWPGTQIGMISRSVARDWSRSRLFKGFQGRLAISKDVNR